MQPEINAPKETPRRRRHSHRPPATGHRSRDPLKGAEPHDQDPLLERNEQFASTYTPAPLGPPTAQVLIVTCLDHRVDPTKGPGGFHALLTGLSADQAPRQHDAAQASQPPGHPPRRRQPDAR
jgi:hypothetical protein